MPKIKFTIGNRIHRLRRSLNMTQQGLAEAIGVNASYIGPLEKGLKCPSIAVLSKLSEVLGQPVFSFFLDENHDVSVDASSMEMEALLASHSAEERRFLLSVTEQMSALLRSRR